MDYEMFKELVTSNFLSYMPNAFKSYDVKVVPNDKTNQTFDALCLEPPDYKAGMAYCNAALYGRRKKHFIFDGINTITAPSFR